MSQVKDQTIAAVEAHIATLRGRKQKRREEDTQTTRELRESERQLSVLTGTRFIGICQQSLSIADDQGKAKVYGVNTDTTTHAGILEIKQDSPNVASVILTFMGGNRIRHRLGLKNLLVFEVTHVADVNAMETTLFQIMMWPTREEAETWAASMSRRDGACLAPGQ